MKMAFVGVAFLLASAAPVLADVGWQTVAVGGAGEPLTVQVWYPAAEPGGGQAIGPFTQTVARNARVRGRNLPLIVISHGSGGAAAYHHHTAIALAEAGFVVAAPDHAGDTAGDMRFSGGPRQFAARARQVGRVIDHLTQVWPQHGLVDAARVGVLGHSAGGTTALIVAGGEPDLTRLRTHCTANPQALDCRFAERMRSVRAAQGAASPALAAPATPGPIRWTHDARVGAIVAAAPALGYVFASEGGLSAVSVPVQIWVGDQDEVTPAVWNAEVVRTHLPTPPESTVVAGAGHPAFLAPCPPSFAAQAPEVCQDPRGFDRGAFNSRFHAAVIAFFRRTLSPRAAAGG